MLQSALPQAICPDATTLQHALNSSPHAVSIARYDDTIIWVNIAFLEMYRCSSEDVLGRHVTFIRSARNNPHLVEQILPATLSGAGWNGELWNCRKDGEEFMIRLRTSLVRDDAGHPPSP